MGSSQAEKAASHERIVTAASRRIRSDGIDNVSVSELMKQAGLTHGGFYRHFGSREDLIAEATTAALAQGSERVLEATKLDPPAALAATIDGYLSPRHRDKPETGCAVAALSTDIVRTDRRAKAAYCRQVHSYIELLADLMPSGDSGEAYLILSALVGALALARAVNERHLSDEILEQTARALHGYIDDGQEI